MSGIPEEPEYSNVWYSGLSRQQTSNVLCEDPNLVPLVQMLVEQHLQVVTVPIISRLEESSLSTLKQQLEQHLHVMTVPIISRLEEFSLSTLKQQVEQHLQVVTVPIISRLEESSLSTLKQQLEQHLHVMTVPIISRLEEFSLSTLKQQLEQHLQVMTVPIIRRLEESLLSTFKPMVENLVQNAVKEGVVIALEKLNARAKWVPGDETHSSEPRHLALKFLDDVCRPVYTGQEIKAEGSNNNIRLALYDTDGNVVNSGSAASSDVEIMVLLEGINDVGSSSSACKEPGSCIKPSSCKKRMSPLLSKNRLKLKEGIAVLDGMKFKHKSEWTKGCKIKLVARAVENLLQTTVEQAETGFFPLRDSRSGWKKKHYPPSLEDEVFRLKKIGKNGNFHRRLNREYIRTVKEFLTEFFIDPTRLRNIMGSGMSTKMWKMIVEHAQTCILDKQLTLCYSPGSQQKQKKGVVFNVVGQVIGVVSDCQYITIDKLSEAEKACARDLAVSAYRHQLAVVTLDNEASLMDGSFFLPTIDYSASPPLLCNSDGNRVLYSHVNATCDHPEPSPTSPDITPLPSLTTLEELSPINSMDASSCDQPLIITGQVESPTSFGTDFNIGQGFFERTEHLQFHNPNDPLFPVSTVGSSSADLQAAVSGFLSRTVPNAKAHKRWAMLFSVLKWFQIRKDVTRRLCWGSKLILLRTACSVETQDMISN